MNNFDLRKYIKEQKEEDSNRIAKAELILPRGKKVYLQAEEQDYQRGLIVELTKEGGYKLNYWYGPDAKVYPAEVEVDGESIKEDAREVYIKFHPELKEGMSLEFYDGDVELNADSGDYIGEIEDDGTVDFSVIGYEEEREDGEIDFDEDNWKDILGPKHAFVQISNQIPTKVEADRDYVMITVDLEDLKNLIK